MGAVQAVTTTTACRQMGQIRPSQPHPPPHRWRHFEPSPWGQLRLSQPLIDLIEHGQHPNSPEPRHLRAPQRRAMGTEPIQTKQRQVALRSDVIRPGCRKQAGSERPRPSRRQPGTGGASRLPHHELPTPRALVWRVSDNGRKQSVGPRGPRALIAHRGFASCIDRNALACRPFRSFYSDIVKTCG